ncbi:MAG TPA: CHRD domain-containing protein, partial [Thermoanaerobaculia bacterium]|nr:CHRD domain-containing protein [Thermoanaerobaculia bacterium]
MKRIAILLTLLALTTGAFAQSYSAVLTGSAEVPGPGDTDGAGLAIITLDGTTLRYNVWTQNIGAPTMAHIHIVPAGVSGPVFIGFNVSDLGNGTVPVTADQANQIRSNPANFYVNVHNADFPAGAVRGQLTGGAAGDGAMTSYIPVVGKVRGQNNTNFVTDLRIINNSASTATVTLDYFGATTVSRQVTVLPGEQEVLDDVVGTTFGVESGLGGLRITSSQNVVSSARVINDLRASGNGTAGFAVDAEAAGGTSGTIAFLANNVDYRTNIGYFNPGTAEATATLTARRSADGTVLGTSTVTIPANGFTQTGVFNV